MSELYHHGILGQKWGKRNGPPYPLDAQDHSARENKAGWRKSLSKSHGSGNSFTLTDTQKKYLRVGAAVVATGLAAYGVYRISAIAKNGGLSKKQLDSLGLRYFNVGGYSPELDNIPVSKINNAKIPEVEVPKVAIGRIEPKRIMVDAKTGKILSGSVEGLSYDANHRVTEAKSALDKILLGANPSHGTNNCTSVSLSIFLKEKGLSFKSKNIGKQNLYGMIEDCFKQIPERDLRESRGIAKYFTSFDSASSKLKEWYGDNANGLISIPFRNSRGEVVAHTFNWSINNGVAEFFDGQPDPPIRNITSYFAHVDPTQLLTVAHLDNLEINYEGISKYLDE